MTDLYFLDCSHHVTGSETPPNARYPNPVPDGPPEQFAHQITQDISRTAPNPISPSDVPFTVRLLPTIMASSQQAYRAQSIFKYTSMTIHCAWSKQCPAQPATKADVGIGTQVCTVNVSQEIVPSIMP